MTPSRWGKVRLDATLRIAPDFSALAVYVFLCTHADRHGFAWPDVDTIAASLGCSESTVRRAIRTLRAGVEVEDAGTGFRVLSEDERARDLRRARRPQ